MPPQIGRQRCSCTAIESLITHVEACDFAVLVLGADDYVISRGRKTYAPRDNVLLELGLFIGALGRRRTFTLLPRAINVKKPSDMLGVTDLFYDPPNTADFRKSIHDACKQIHCAITELGPSSKPVVAHA